MEGLRSPKLNRSDLYVICHFKISGLQPPSGMKANAALVSYAGWNASLSWDVT